MMMMMMMILQFKKIVTERMVTIRLRDI